MSALFIYDTAPLGSHIRYSDGAPRPPARFTKKLAAWESRNGSGRLVKKEPPRSHAAFASPASITLHESDFDDRGVITVTILRTHSVTSTLRFDVAELPPIGSVRILHDVGDNMELLYLAVDREAAEDWLSKNPYSRARLETVMADELAAASVEGRAA
jgi:hypothetical protein